MSVNLKNRSFLKLLDFTPEEINFLLDLSFELKKAKYEGVEEQRLKGKNIALIFEKTSTRTRCAFEVAAFDQGAQISYLGPSGTQIGHKESMKDTARVLGRMYDGIEYRGFGQDLVEILALNAGVPVWNGLTDEFHPTQVLADIMTMMEYSNKPLNQISFCYSGDARNNMGNSLLIGAAKMGMDFRAAAPTSLQPSEKLVNIARDIAQHTGARLTITDDLKKAVRGVDFLYTDVWLSMGEPEDAWEQRIDLLKPYQINKEIVAQTENPSVKFLHCLPSFHNRETRVGEDIFKKFGLKAMEVTDDVFESDISVVFQQSENRIHTIKAIMVATLGD
ncbi:MAG: ornithine carbamoyltransferase [Bacteroides sp. SM23_62_1]|nr:MAG: ornithine carbamoyltransferase [Bacteroides sp. SM23_62_1]